MQGRNDEINELLATMAKLAELAARNQLPTVSHLLDMLQLELIMVLGSYSSVDDVVAEAKSVQAAKSHSAKSHLTKSRSAKRSSGRGRNA